MSKIPEGATHWRTDDKAHPFRKKEDHNDWFAWVGKRWVGICIADPCSYEYRPITEHPDYVAPVANSIQLTPSEIQSGLDRVKWAEGLIRQLPEDHDGRNSWLLNYGNGFQDYVAPEQGKMGQVEWSGTGLPPVGTVCEARQGCEDWKSVEIIAHFRNQAAMVAAFIPTADGRKRVDQAIGQCFRPIRTPEQIAAEERQNAIEELGNLLCSKSDAPTTYLWQAAQLVIDASYRKQDPQK